LKGYSKGEKASESRLRLSADLVSYIPVIVTFRRWSLRRRFYSMDTVLEGILDFMLHGIEVIPEE